MSRLTRVFWLSLSCVCLTACGDAELPLGPDRDGDSWPEDLDCEDGDPSVFPAADDIPDDGIDQDCSGSDATAIGGLGGGLPCILGDCGGAAGGPGSGGAESPSGGGGSGLDPDGDGHDGTPAGDDCDDQRPDVHPDAREVVLNGIDEDCDGSDLVGADQLIPILSLDATPAAPPDLAASVLDGAAVFLAAWSDSRTAPGQDLYAQLLDADGEPIGEELAVDITDNAAKTGVRVASGADGFLVAWTTADGTWARRLAADGTPEGIVLQFGAAGSTDPVPAFSGDHWAVAWRVPTELRAEIRAMTPDGVRGDIHELGSTEISAVSLTGSDDGFVAVWEGGVNDDDRGIWAQRCSVTGYPEGAPSLVFEGAASAPAAASTGEETLVAFGLSGSFGHAAAQRLGSEFEPLGSGEPMRLSSESVGQFGFRVSSNEGAFAILWNDARHLSHAPPADSVYGNLVTPQGPAVPSGAPQLASAQGQLGGLAPREGIVNSYFASVVTENGPSLLVVQF